MGQRSIPHAILKSTRRAGAPERTTCKPGDASIATVCPDGVEIKPPRCRRRNPITPPAQQGRDGNHNRPHDVRFLPPCPLRAIALPAAMNSVKILRRISRIPATPRIPPRNRRHHASQQYRWPPAPFPPRATHPIATTPVDRRNKTFPHRHHRKDSAVKPIFQPPIAAARCRRTSSTAPNPEISDAATAPFS